jgi:alpha-galactosidase
MKPDEKIVLIGAGSAMFTRGLVSDLIKTRMEVELALVDIDPQALETAYRLAEKMIAARQAPIRLTCSIDRKQALPGATIVITTIGVGGRRAWEQDVYIPRTYGISMPVGDTVGPGGSARVLRMVPAMVAIARDILDLAPQALFFNYANPMAAVCHAVRKATGANVIGLCIGTYETALYLSEALEISLADLSYSAGGINHLTWFTEMRARGEDAMPRLHAIASKKLEALAEVLEESRAGRKLLPHNGSPFDSSIDFPFSWQCLKWFNAFPAPLDRHVTEFFPQLFRDGSYYGKTLGVDEFSFEGTISVGDRIYQEMQADAASPASLTEQYFEKLGGEHEQVLEIIRSIRENRGVVFFANLPNQGQVPNLPQGVIVETPAVADSRGLHAIIQSALPAPVAGSLATRYAWVETVVEAALEGDREKFIAALILDGAVKSPGEAASLADALLEAHASYLPQFQR